MRKCFVIILFCFMLILLGGCVEAATFKITASKTQVNPNETFSVSVGGDCIGRVNLSVTNGTLSTNSVWVEQNYQTVSVKAGSSGTVTITATPTAGFSDSDANEYKPGARSTKVTINTINNPTPSEKPNNNSVKKPPVVIEKKSSNNLLSSLSTNIGSLTPNFDANINEYSIELPKDTQTISINAGSQDNKARIEGIGEIKLEPGENLISIKVIAEDNSEKTYTIKAYVDESPQVYLKYKDKDIGIARNLRNITIPEGFNKKEHIVNGYSISIFDNEYFSIVYGIDNQDIRNFYIINTEKNECINKITPITIDNHFFFLIDLQEEREGFEISSIKIEDKEIIGYKFKNGFTDYFLLSVMNNKGEIIDYLYETKEGTLQLYSDSAPINYNEYKELINEVSNKQVIIYILSIFVVLNIICSIILFFKLRKEKLDEKVH